MAAFRVLLMDNYDSFVYNLAQLAGSRGAEVRVERNDRIALEEARAWNPDAIMISPGPGNPEDPRWFGVCGALIRELSSAVPTLGVCLGHQGIGAAFGGHIVPARTLVHGKATPVRHDGDPLFAGVPDPFPAGRYHSLVIDRVRVPEELRVIAWTEDGEVMAVRHATRPLVGVQFHVESILTPHGATIFDNFLREVKGGRSAA